MAVSGSSGGCHTGARGRKDDTPPLTRVTRPAGGACRYVKRATPARADGGRRRSAHTRAPVSPYHLLVRPILFAAALAVAGVCAYVVLRSDRPAAPASTEPAEAPVKGAATPTPPPSLPSGPSAGPTQGKAPPPKAQLDAEVADAVAKVMPTLKTRDDLDHYLD